jgi:hypothetical protein
LLSSSETWQDSRIGSRTYPATWGSTWFKPLAPLQIVGDGEDAVKHLRLCLTHVPAKAGWKSTGVYLELHARLR